MVSKRVRSVQLSGIRKMFELAGKDTINLGIGEPDFQPHPKAIEALSSSAKEGKNKYTSTFGITELREKIAEVLLSKRTDYTKDNVLITTGGSHALYIATQTIVDPGDEVLVPNPGFPIYAPHVILAGGRPVYYSLEAENDFLPSLEELQEKASKNTKAIIVNTPQNPTGGVLGEKEVKGIIEIAEDYDMYIIADEVYDVFVFEGSHVSFLGRYDKVLYPYSFSKRFAMTGWRIGFLAADPEIIKEAMKMGYYTVTCPPAPIQYAIYKILGDPELEEYSRNMMKEYRERRDIVYSYLSKMDHIFVPRPKGAFYIFPKYDLEMPSEEFCMRFLKRYNVAVTPGKAFGSKGEYHFRISFSASRSALKTAMERLREFVSSFRSF